MDWFLYNRELDPLSIERELDVWQGPTLAVVNCCVVFTVLSFDIF